MPNEPASDVGDRRPPSAAELFRRFHELYDASAADQTTELGLFYDRHHKYVQYEPLLDPNRPEYLDHEWNRVFASFLGSLARELGFVPGREWTDPPGMVWYWSTSPTEVGVTIQEVNTADDSVLNRDVPRLARDGAPLSILFMYPDYPAPPGALTVSDSIQRWRESLERTLGRLGVDRDFLVAMISAYAWELPSSWTGFAWDRQDARLRPLEAT